MKRWRSTRFLSLFLVLALLFQMLPVQALAATDDESTAVAVEEGQHEVSVLGEVEDLREEGTKHFRLSDGSFVAVSYGMPVHFQNGNGEWTDIDNRLSLAAGAYRTANATAPVAFSSTLTDGKLFSAEHNGQSVSMTLLDTAMADRMISGELEPEETVPDETDPTGITEATEATEVTEATVPEETQSSQTEPAEEVPEELEVTTEATEKVYTEKAPDAFEFDTNAPAEDAFEPMSEEAEAKVLRLWMEEKMFGLDAKDLIPIVISILALTLTLFQYFGEYDRNRKQATLEAYDQLQGEVFLTLNKLRKQYPILSPDRNFEERPTITNCLAKLERFCVGINLRIFDLRTLERCGGAYFVRQYLYLKPIIQDKRTRKNGGAHYDEFEKVAMKLKKKYERRSETINWDEITMDLLQEKTKSDE